MSVSDESPFIRIPNYPTDAYIGESYGFTIEYGNTGQATIAAPLPPDVTYVSSRPAGIYNAASHTVQWTVGTLAPGSLGERTVQVAVDAHAVRGSIEKNQALFIQSRKILLSIERKPRLVTTSPTHIRLSVDPPVILGDGQSTGTLTAYVVDILGNPVDNATVITFQTGQGTFQNGTTSIAKQTQDGVAEASLLSPVLAGLNPMLVPVTVSAVNPYTGRV